MRVRMTMLATSLAILGCLAIRGFAQDPNGIAQDPGLSPKAGHTLGELRKGIKAEAQQVGEKLGEVGQGIKSEARQVTGGVARRFEAVKADVHKMPMHHRVYSRLHWDKSLHDSTIEVHMLRDGVVLLRGTVPSEEARKHALDLSMGTAGVNEVYDELKLAGSVPPTKPATSTGASVGR